MWCWPELLSRNMESAVSFSHLSWWRLDRTTDHSAGHVGKVSTLHSVPFWMCSLVCRTTVVTPFPNQFCRSLSLSPPCFILYSKYPEPSTCLWEADLRLVLLSPSLGCLVNKPLLQQTSGRLCFDLLSTGKMNLVWYRDHRLPSVIQGQYLLTLSWKRHFSCFPVCQENRFDSLINL